jgi:hypothetical protein
MKALDSVAAWFEASPSFLRTPYRWLREQPAKRLVLPAAVVFFAIVFIATRNGSGERPQTFGGDAPVVDDMLLSAERTTGYQAEEKAGGLIASSSMARVNEQDGALAPESPQQVNPQAPREPSPTGAPGGTQSANSTERKLIYIASLRVHTDNVEAAAKQSRELTGKYGGYVSAETLSRGVGSRTLDQTLRVPRKDFDRLMAELEGLGSRVTNKSISAQDVTEEYVDVSARLQSKKAAEKQLLILLTRAGNVRDLLAVQEQLRVVREEIESVEGRLRYLNNQVDYCTIQLSLYDWDWSAPDQPGFLADASAALAGGWYGLLAFVATLLGLWPLWLLAGAAYAFWRWRADRQSAV